MLEKGKVTTAALMDWSGSEKSYHKNYPENVRHKKTTYPARVKWLFLLSIGGGSCAIRTHDHRIKSELKFKNHQT